MQRLIRYSRQICLPEIGISGQQRLEKARVLVVGAGGLGVPVIQYLAAAGTGTIGIADGDIVERSNLQRQPVYTEADEGLKKTHCAAAFIRARNSSITVKEHDLFVNENNARGLIHDYDIVVDGTDSLAARYGLNDACVLEGKPMVYGSVYRFEGQVSVFNYKNRDGFYGPNYRDLFPVPPPPELVPDCSEAGVFGALPGIIGGIQAMETIKWITGAGTLLCDRMLIIDGLSMTSRTIAIPNTGSRDSITEVRFSEPYCDAGKDKKGASADEYRPETPGRENSETGLAHENLAPEELFEWMKSGQPFTLVDVRERWERQLVHIGGIHIPLRSIGQCNGVPADTAASGEAIASRMPSQTDPEIQCPISAKYTHKHTGSDGISSIHPVVFYCRSGVRSSEAIQRYRHAMAQLHSSGNPADAAAATFNEHPHGTNTKACSRAITGENIEDATRVYHLAGGILAWREIINPGLPKY